MAREIPKDFDPFAPLSAKPKDDGERLSRRVKEGASAGGKWHRGHGLDSIKTKFIGWRKFRAKKGGA